jgi:uncharacterized RDD family membrane protein YckC
MSAYDPYPPKTPSPAGGPTPIAASELLASRWRRVFALVLDVLFLIVPFVVLAFLFGVFEDTSEYTQDELDGIVGSLALVSLALYVLLYLPLLMARSGARNGQTLGKQALGVRVVTAEGVPVTYGRALRRELLGNYLIALVTVLIYSIVDYAFGLFDSRRQCLHDKIGSTYVVNEAIPFGDGRPILPARVQQPVGLAAPPPWGQQPAPYAQPPEPPGPPAAPYGQPSPQEQPASPETPREPASTAYGEPSPHYGRPGQRSRPPAPPFRGPAPQFRNYPSTHGEPEEAPDDEPLYPRAPGADVSPERPAPPQPPRSPLTARAETPQQSWSPPRPREDDGNDAARRAFGDDR